jgi:hypothetical protein
MYVALSYSLKCSTYNSSGVSKNYVKIIEYLTVWFKNETIKIKIIF